MPFAVTYTSGPKSTNPKQRSLLLPRRDLDMKVQRRTAYVDSRARLQKALIKDYETTVGTRTVHFHFLYQILNEVQRYQLMTHGVRIPDLALEILADELADEMRKTKVDRYSHCLALIGGKKMYSPGFIHTAAELVDYRKQCDMATSPTSFTEGGLSSGTTFDEEDADL